MDSLKTLFSTVILYRHNLHVLHWKAKGCDFDCIHGLLDTYVDKFNGFVDEIAEIMLMMGTNPLSIQDCLKIAEDDSDITHIIIDPNSDYDAEECINHVKTMFDTLMNVYENVCDEDDIPNDIIATFDNHVGWIRLENKYKNVQRLK